MSESTRNKMRKKRETSETVVSDFINKNENPSAAKKMKKTVSENLDDSLKFFKTIKPRATKPTEPVASSSTVVSNFIDESNKKPKAKPQKKQSKPALRKTKTTRDIRKIFGKQEEMFNHVVAENCIQEGLDPDEMQLALAISKSLKHQNKFETSEPSASSSVQFDNPFTSIGKVKPISAALERFGFKCKKTYTEYELDLITNEKLSKRSKFRKIPTALTRTSSNKRNEVIRVKIDRILGSNTTIDWDDIEATNHDYVVSSYYLQELQEKSRTIFKLNGEDRLTDIILLNYYVSELFEPSFVRADHLLKDWNKISGRDPSPDKMHHKETIQPAEEEEPMSQNDVCNNQNELKISDTQPNVEELNNIDEDSEMDIFADIEDFDKDEILIPCSDEETESSENNTEDLADKLDLLQVKLSQTMTVDEVNKKNKSIDSEATIENVDFISDSCALELLKEDTIDLISESGSNETKAEPLIDLTQRDISTDATIAIPYDDSYYSLQLYVKNLDSEKEIFTEVQVQKEETQQLSFTQVDLVSTDDESLNSSRTLPIKDTSNELFPNEGNESLNCSQQSLEGEENEVINISDEEVNYSMRKFHNDYEDPSDASLEADEVKEESFDLTQSEPETFEHFVINNIAEQSLLEFMPQEVFNIETTVTNLLENSVHCSNLNFSVNRTVKVASSDGLSDSVREIMSKYCVNVDEKETSRTFRKMQSETSIVDHIAKRRKTENFSLEENDDIVDLTQQIEDDSQSRKENEFLNFSIHQSLENIASPIRPLKQTQSQIKSKKKSLGIDIDKDYIVDIESVVSEPDYQNMTPVELKKALFKYGIRPLPVKKAISLLEYIYDQLHPKIQIAAEEEIDANNSRREMNLTDIATNIESCEDENYPFAIGLVDDEEYVLPKMRKSKKPTCAIPLHISFYNMVRSNEKLQNFILEFRPIELDQIHKHFRKFGLTYQPNDIIAFLDKRCITFKTKEQSYSKTHERKQQKRTQKSQQKQSQSKT